MYYREGCHLEYTHCSRDECQSCLCRIEKRLTKQVLEIYTSEHPIILYPQQVLRTSYSAVSVQITSIYIPRVMILLA